MFETMRIGWNRIYTQLIDRMVYHRNMLDDESVKYYGEAAILVLDKIKIEARSASVEVPEVIYGSARELTDEELGYHK